LNQSALEVTQNTTVVVKPINSTVQKKEIVIIANDTKKLNNFTQICASQFVPSLLNAA
jgi:hypothetical protein